MALRSSTSEQKKVDRYKKEQDQFMESVYELHPLDNDHQELNAALMDCIDRLNKEQQKCIEKFYFDDKCYQEIAVELGINEKKVKSYLQNGKRNLKICLERKNVRE